MKNSKQAWEKLVASARLSDAGAAPGPDGAPFGFSTRMAALGMAAYRPQGTAAVFARFSMRALGISSVLALAAVCLNLGALRDMASADYSDPGPVAATPIAPETPATAPAAAQPAPVGAAASAQDSPDGAVDEVMAMAS